MNPDLQKESHVPGRESGNEGNGSFSLAPAQARMWQVFCNDPRDTLYNGSFRMNLAGPVDPVILESSLGEIVRRHDVLRARFEIIRGEPRCIIAPFLQIKIGVRDLRTIPGELRENEMDTICRKEAELPFDLARGPLIRAGLLQMEDQRHILTLTVHQIICDGWSIGLIMEELQKIYAAFVEGKPSPLPTLTVQYGDFVTSRQEGTSGQAADRQLKYWMRQLRGYHRLEITPDLADANRSSSQAEIISHLLPRELTDRLRDLSTEQGSTFFITSLATCLLLLYRYTGEKDLSVGSPLAGRIRTELETLIGQFVNHTVFRADAADNLPFKDFLARVKNSVWEAMANQDVPFEDVLKALGSASARPPEPFFVINFICQREYGRASTFNFDFTGIRMSTMPSKSQGALYDLNFFLVEREIGWRLSLEYKTSFYRPETARQLLDHFRELLEGIASDPNRRLSEFPLSGNIPAPPLRMNGSEGGEVYAMPASLAQQRYWRLARLDPRTSSFSMPACVHISGALSPELLQRSFAFLIDRHEILRTTFEELNNEIVQIVSPIGGFSLPISDLSGVPAAGRDSRLQQLIRIEASLPMNLEKGPLLRVRLFRLSDNDHVLVSVIHHILADGWSNSILQNDLWSAYSAYAEGREPALIPLEIQYSDFAAWQSEWVESAEAQVHLDFWTKRLSGDLAILNFPTDRASSMKPASHGAIETLLLPEKLVRELKSMGQSLNVTPFTVLLAAFGVILTSGSGQDNVIIGSPFANRRAETEPLIGPFSGPLCLRLDFSGDPTLLEVLQHAHSVTLDALSHTDLPFELLLDRVRMRTVQGRRPLFQFYFFYQKAFLQPRRVGALEITPLPTFSTGTPFEMQLGMIERPEGIRAELEYNPDLYDASTIRALLTRFLTLLGAMTSDGGRRISEVPQLQIK